MYKQQAFVQARMAFNNTIQIDPDFAQGYYHLGLVELQTGDFNQASHYLKKAIALDHELIPAHLALGKLFMAAKEPDKALDKAQLILTSAPADVEALKLKAAALLQKSKTIDARHVLTEQLKKNVIDPEIYSLLTFAALRQHDPQEARRILKEGIVANPESAHLCAMLAGICIRTGQFASAENAIHHAIKLEPDHLPHKLKLAEIYWQTNNKYKANRLIGEVLKKKPVNETIYLDAARFHMACGNDKDAEQVLRAGMAMTPSYIAFHLALGEVYIGRHRPELAVKTINAALAKITDVNQSDLIKAKNLLAKANLLLGELSTVETIVNDLLGIQANNLDAHLTMGRVFMRRMAYENAISEFRTAIAHRPEVIKAHLLLSEAQLLNGEYREALKTLHSASKEFPKVVELHRATAKIYASQKNFTAAENELRHLLSIAPDDYRTYADLGDLSMLAGDLDQAEGYYIRLSRLAPQDVLGPLKLSRLYLKQQNSEKSIEILKMATKQRLAPPELLTALVDTYLSLKRFDDAINLCRSHIEKYPRKPGFIHNLLGRVHLERRDHVNAEKALKTAIERQPRWAEPYDNIATLYLREKKTSKVIKALNTSLDFNQRNPSAYMNLGKLYEQKKAYADAMAIYSKALSIHPNLWRAANNLAFLLSEFGTDPSDLEQALKLGKRAIVLCPNDPLVQDTLAWIHYKQGNLQVSFAMLKKAITEAPENPILNYHMGVILSKKGRTDAAIEKLTQALSKDRDFPGRKNGESLLHSLEKSRQERMLN